MSQSFEVISTESTNHNIEYNHYSNKIKRLTLVVCSIGIDRFWVVGLLLFFFSCSNGEKTFSVGLVDQLFQPASKQGETVEKAFVLLCRVIVARVRAIRRSYRVSTENGWKSVLLRNVNRISPNRLRLKRLIPIEHDLSKNFMEV